MVELTELDELRGLKAKHIPFEIILGKWQRNPQKEEDVILLKYFLVYPREAGDAGIFYEGILFIRSDWTLGKDRIDSFIIDSDDLKGSK